MHQIAAGKLKWPGYSVFFKDGKLVISGSYQRTGGLEKSLGYTVSDSGGRTVIKYGTPLSGAQYVIGEKQSKYHAGNWRKLSAVVGEAVESLGQYPVKSFVREFEKRIKG